MKWNTKLLKGPDHRGGTLETNELFWEINYSYMPSLIVKQWEWVRLNETDFGNEFILNKNALFFYEIVHGWKNSIDTFICWRLYYKCRLVVFAYYTREFEMKLIWRKIHEWEGNWLGNGWMNFLIFSAKMFQMPWNSSSINQLNQTWQQ